MSRESNGRTTDSGEAMTDGGEAMTDGGEAVTEDGEATTGNGALPQDVTDALDDGRWTGEKPVEVIVGDVLRDRNETLATAESLTGGLIGSTVTDVPGSSDYFDRGFVTYAYDAKRAELAVPREALDAHGAVSEPVAEAMARGARDRADTSWGLSATGVAGPGGGRDEKPVGLVYVGVAYAAPWGTEASFVRSRRFTFDGDRATIKRKSVESALATLAATIEEDGAETA